MYSMRYSQHRSGAECQFPIRFTEKTNAKEVRTAVDRVNPCNRRDVLPAVSVIIPTFNRRSVVTECLRALVRQDCLPDRFEVIVVDDGSGDGTAQAVAAQASASTPHIVLVR